MRAPLPLALLAVAHVQTTVPVTPAQRRRYRELSASAGDLVRRRAAETE